MGESTKEAIQDHQAEIIQRAISIAEESDLMPDDLKAHLAEALEMNAQGDVDGAMDLAGVVRGDADALSYDLDNILRALRGIDEDPPAPADGKDGR